MSNPTSTIILYKDSKIIPSRNMVVESISDYLANLTKITINDFQYMRHHLEMEIKIDKSQIWQEFDITYNYNYLSIQNSDASKVVYYFIVGKRQIANSTIALSLRLDTANTFTYNTDYTPTERTKVIREHKDRFNKYVYQITFNDLQTASWAIGEAFPYNDGTIFNVNVEFQSSGEDTYLTHATARYFEDGVNKKLILINQNIDEGLLLEGNTDFIRMEIYKDDYSGLYCSIVNFDDVIIEVEHNKVRNIDYYSEGINPVLYKEELGILDNTNGLEWNLIYRNHAEGENVAIDCFCLSSEGNIQIAIPATTTLTYTDFEDGKYYLFAPFDNIKYSFVGDDTHEYFVQFNTSIECVCKVVYRTGTTLKIRSVVYRNSFINAYGKLVLTSNRTLYNWITINSLTIKNILGAKYYKSSSIPNPLVASIYEPNGVFNVSLDTTEDLSNLNEVNRADPKLVKIITIPYFPSVYKYDPATYTLEVDSTWVYENSTYKSLQLNNLNTNFTSTITSTIMNPLNIFDMGSFTPNPTANRDDTYESKLFNSEFYQPKFVYDSFGFIFELEKMNEGMSQPTYFTFEFVMTSTINSKFMFKFNDYHLKLSTQDYDNILTIARNNEAPIYNSAYINYLMSAYRYDLKALGYGEARTYMSAIGKTLSTFEGGYSAGTGENASALVAGYKVAKGVISTIFNGIMTLNEKEMSMEAKITALKNQSVSVSGSDDLDLMKNYAGNKAKLCLYEPSPRMKHLIADLFYYFGYTTEELKKPVINTRSWFNFLQCELELANTGNNLTEEVIEDLKARFRSGITFFHKVNGTWDLDQVKENWEVSIL